MNNKMIELPIDVETYDIDLAGHVNNVVYIRWLEMLRTKLFTKLCLFNDLIRNNFYIVIISTNIIYKKQIKMFDRPVGWMEVKDIKHGIIYLEAIIKCDNRIAAVAEQKCVVMDLGTCKKVDVKTLDKIIKLQSVNSGNNL